MLGEEADLIAWREPWFPVADDIRRSRLEAEPSEFVATRMNPDHDDTG
jgi:hypothetical protein